MDPPWFLHLPVTTANSKVGNAHLEVKLRLSIRDELTSPWLAEQIALAFDNALQFDAAQPQTAAVG